MSERQRPNANYKLSKPDSKYNEPINEDELVFYYNREERLAKASKAVRDIYDAPAAKPRRFGLFSVLVSTRPNRFIFGTLIILCLVIFVLSRIGTWDNVYTLDGNRIAVSGVRSHGATVLTVTKTITGGNLQNVHSGAVDVIVAPADDGEVFVHRMFFSLAEEEVYSFVVPFDVPELEIMMVTHRASLGMVLRPD
ncbi:MAG: hypothetical protein FWG66_16010 [Spirochaetes bacterium]|nr:hypothetical protein [Spirochaetota bacterium]